MAAFNTKPLRKLPLEGRTTLDNLHQLQMGEMQDQKRNMSKLQEDIRLLQKQIENSPDIISRSKNEEKLLSLRKKQESVLSDSNLFNYFFETGPLLYTYYDLQDKINQGGTTGISRRIKAKPGSVLAALGGTEDTSNETKPAQTEGRDVLLEKYLNKVDPEHARIIQTVSEDPNGICELCDLEMKFSTIEALFFCEK
jgi:hypothetical protein